MKGPRPLLVGALCLLGLGLGLGLGLWTGVRAAEGDQLLATLDKPAVVTATKRLAANGEGARSAPRVVVNVTGYRPPQDGSAVQVVVKAQQPGGGEREVGRFGITPNTAFVASDPARGRRFGLPLPVGLVSDGPIKLNVYVVTSRGEGGEGAQVEIGGAEIR